MVEWITGTLSSMGYLGIVLLMIAENIFPPIPSELIMPFAGFTAAKGDMNIVLVVLAGTAGSVIGALPWYYAGKLLGKERLKHLAGRRGRWLTVTPGDIEKADAWFDRHGHKAVLLGRMVPTVRTLISVPAGLSGMRLTTFLVYSLVGTLVWTAFLAVAGYLLEDHYDRIADYVAPVSKGVVALIVVGYLYRVVSYRPTGS